MFHSDQYFLLRRGIGVLWLLLVGGLNAAAQSPGDLPAPVISADLSQLGEDRVGLNYKIPADIELDSQAYYLRVHVLDEVEEWSYASLVGHAAN